MSVDEGAFTPADIPQKPMFTLVTPSTPTTAAGTTRRRGRPPGSKNKSTLEREGSIARNPSMQLGSGRGAGTSPNALDDVDKDANRKAEKKARAEEYARYISEEVNDKIFMAIVMLSGGKVPSDAFYQPGKAPAMAKSDDRLSDLGKTVAIPPDMAKSWGKLLAELSYTDTGKTATKYAGSSSLAIIGAALTAILTTVQYAVSIKPVVEGIKLMQQQANETNENNESE